MNGSGATAVEAAVHRRLAVDLFNRAWRLLGQGSRTQAEDDELVHVAHASRLHWQEAGGTPAHLARGEWMCARVYAVLGRPEPAGWHARRALELVDAGGEGFADWDRAAALEGMAHASLAAGDREAALDWAARAREALATVAEADDRAVVEGQLAELGLGAR